MIVAGLDTSLTKTGVALIDTQDRLHVETTTVGVRGHQDATLRERNDRLQESQDQVINRLGPWCGLVVIEAPAFASRSGHMHDRSGLWWLIVQRLHQRGIPVVEVAPTVRAKYATGKGNSAKGAVVDAVARRYPHVVTGGDDNVCDAVVLAAIGARLLGEPVEDSLPKTHTDALTSLVLPPGAGVDR